jgi:hypothetical protein
MADTITASYKSQFEKELTGDLLTDVSTSNALGQAVYEPAEESIADVRRQFKVGRNWDYLMGIVDILKRKGTTSIFSQGNKWDKNAMQAMGMPSLLHMRLMMDAVESAYLQGLLSSPISASTEQVTEYFANYIVDREASGIAVKEKYESGQIPLTPLEEEAYALASQWKEMYVAGQTPPQEAFEAVYKGEMDTSITSSSPIQIDLKPIVATSFVPTSPNAPLVSAKDKLGFGAPVKPNSDVFEGKAIAQVAFTFASVYTVYQLYKYLCNTGKI